MSKIRRGVQRLLLVLSMLSCFASPAFGQRPIVKGSVEQSVVIRIVDSVLGTPETGVTETTPGLDLEYRREGQASENITVDDLMSLTDAHADGGLLHIGNGYYRLDVPDGAFTGADGVLIHGTANDMIVLGVYVPLVAVDPQNATPPVKVTQFGGTNGTFASGRPEVTIKDGTGAGEIDTSGGAVVRCLEKSQVVLVSTVNSITSPTEFDLTSGIPLPGGGAFDDWIVIARDVSSSHVPKLASARRIVTTDQAGGLATLTINAAFGFALVTGDIIEIYPPDFETLTRLPNATAGAAGGIFIAGTNAATTANITGNVTGNLSGSVGSVTGAVGSVTGNVGGNVVGTVGGFATGALANLFDTSSGKSYSDAIPGSVVKEVADHATTPSLTAAGIADAVLDELLAGHTMAGSLSKAVSDIYAFLNGAPTFAQAMDDHGYTSSRAAKIDKIAPSLLLSTTINDSTVTQTNFTLAAGPPDNDALNGALVLVTKQGAPTQKAVGLVKDYDHVTLTVTLVTDPEIFTFANGDIVDVVISGSPAALWLGSSP